VSGVPLTSRPGVTTAAGAWSGNSGRIARPSSLRFPFRDLNRALSHKPGQFCALLSKGRGHLRSNTRPIRKRRGVTRGASTQHPMLEIYFDTDFLNMRSIFSLIASMAVELD
jgi:hypothetical protein